MQVRRFASLMLIALCLLPARFIGAQSSRGGFVELEVGRSVAVDDQWPEPEAISLGVSVARRFHENQGYSLFAGMTLGATLTNGSDLTCRTLPTGECAPLFPEFGMFGVLFGADVIAGRLRGQVTLAPSIFVSPDYDNTYGVQVGAGASFQVQKHVALTANARRAVISGFEPYLGDFRIVSFGLRLQ